MNEPTTIREYIAARRRRTEVKLTGGEITRLRYADYNEEIDALEHWLDAQPKPMTSQQLCDALSAQPPQLDAHEPKAVPPTTKLDELQKLLIAWRAAERKHGAAVLRAFHPNEIKKLADAEAHAVRDLRIFVDSEPWAEIAQHEPKAVGAETKVGTPPLWYTAEEMRHYLTAFEHYSDAIAAEIATGYAYNLQHAFEKGWTMATSQIDAMLAERERKI